MSTITFDALARIQLPRVRNPSAQSLYLFNMYRAGSSVSEAAVDTLCEYSDYVSCNPVQSLSAAGVAIVDHGDYSRTSIFVDQQGLSLDQLGHFGGYIYNGFREIPVEYARRFIFTSAAVIIARDFRDIAISQYNSVKRHLAEGSYKGDIEGLQTLTQTMPLEQFVLADFTIAFLKRIAHSYAPLVHKGTPVLHYEDFFVGGRFNTLQLLSKMHDAFSKYLRLSAPLSSLVWSLEKRVEESPHLAGHSTGGQTSLYKNLPPEVKKALTDALDFELKVFGYI